MRAPIFLMLVCSLLLSFEGKRYSVGEGYRPTEEPIYIAGYLSTVAEVRSYEQRIALDEMALMIYGEYSRWGFMSEFETKDYYTKRFEDDYDYEDDDYDEDEDDNDDGGGDSGGSAASAKSGSGRYDNVFYIERLNVRYYFDDDSRIKIGKFFSEVGFWNTWPINVLRFTTSNPHFVETLFPRMTTGVEYKRYISDARLYITLQNNDGLDDRYSRFRTDRHYALSVAFDGDRGEWKAGVGRYMLKSGTVSNYMTLGYFTGIGDWTFLSEGGVKNRSGSDTLAYDLYLQGVWHVSQKHDLSLRVEGYRDIEDLGTSNSVTLGYAYRPRPFMALKSELDIHDNGPRRLLLSFSIMF